jgi:hypothetical protein
MVSVLSWCSKGPGSIPTAATNLKTNARVTKLLAYSYIRKVPDTTAAASLALT